MPTPTPFSPFMSDAKEAPAYWFLDILWIVHVTGAQTGGQYSIIEQLMPEDSGPPPHVHPINESFYVMEGEITVSLGPPASEITLVLGPGTTGHVPRNTVHSFKTTKGPCRLLNFYTPAGLEQIIIGSAQPAEARTLPPKDFDKQTSDQMSQAFSNYWSADGKAPWAVQ